MTGAAPSAVTTGLATVATIVVAMAMIALVEAGIPLHRRTRWNSVHLGPNLTLMFITFATNLVFNAALVFVLVELQARQLGLLHWFGVRPLAAGVIVVVGLDFA